MVRKHRKNCPVPLVPTTVELQVILYKVLCKYKILLGAYKIIISNSAHTITSFSVFVINIIKMNIIKLRLEEWPSLLTQSGASIQRMQKKKKTFKDPFYGWG